MARIGPSELLMYAACSCETLVDLVSCAPCRRRAGVVTSEYAKTFYLGTKLMTPEKARAVWAIYVWCRRTDELVDGPNASRITPEVGPAAS